MAATELEGIGLGVITSLDSWIEIAEKAGLPADDIDYASSFLAWMEAQLGLDCEGEARSQRLKEIANWKHHYR